MKNIAVSFLLAGLLALPVMAQTGNTERMDKAAASGPPKIIQIFREEVKPGKGGPHETSEAVFANMFRKMNLSYFSLGLTSVTGPTDAWFVVPADNYAEVAKEYSAFGTGQLGAEMTRLNVTDGDLLNSQNTWIATYVKDMSYRPDFKLGDTRFFATSIYRIKPGYITEFKELYKASIAAHEKAGIDEHLLMYEVDYGAPTGTYIVFKPLQKIDELDAVEHSHGDTYKQALGADWEKKRDEFAKGGVINVDSNIYSINPRMSYVGPDVVAAAPNYWMPKENAQNASMTAPTHMKNMKKKGMVTPAGKKTETTK